MSRNLPSLRLLCSAAVVSLAVAVVPLHLRAGNEVEQHLRDQYNDKTLVLRNFYTGNRLSYDTRGTPTNSADQGDWTVDGFTRVIALNVSGGRLTIELQRLAVGNVGKTFQFQKFRNKKEEKKAQKENRLHIEVAVESSGLTAEKAGDALSKVFLTSQDRLADLVPDYWKPCVLAASTGRGKKKYIGCSFPPEFAAIPGVVFTLDQSPQTETVDSEARASSGPALKIGKGLNPPKVMSQQDPSFSEQARHAKYQGIAVLSLIVSKTGEVRNIRIVSPLGFGLDQRAVEAISTWQFKPAMKDGEPIEMDINVEVDFHLY
jgi:TonB family protein